MNIKNFVGLILLILPALTFAQPDEINQYKEIRYEYYNKNSSVKTPIIICVPGFTQHNRSPEFLMLKNYFKRNDFSFLIMNPPLHGENFTCFKKCYSWGENEVNDLLQLTKYLHVWDMHSDIHLLGFSIGAKIVLKFGALPEIRNSLSSIIAVASPYRVEDINMRLSGDICKIPEGIVSSMYAYDRAGFVRILLMALGSMKESLIVKNASPAREIPLIKAPTLILHSSDDWLTKSYHSVKLYKCAKNNNQFSLVIIDSRAHAEDMLSRDVSKVRNAFWGTLDRWFDYIDKKGLPEKKNSFNKLFIDKLDSNNQVKNLLIPSEKISLMTSPTFNELNTNLWISAADHNHSTFTVNSIGRLSNNKISRHFFSFGSTTFQNSLIDRFRIGISVEQEKFNKFSSFESYLSYYSSFGPILGLMLRRVTFLGGIGNSFNRKILSLDLALLLLDFQLNFGKFINNENLCQVNFNFPLIGDAYASYFWGLGFSKFLSSTPDMLFKNNIKTYFVIGPKFPIFNIRARLILQIEQNELKLAASDRIWSAGVSLNFQEK